ncbi:enolase C-terminal domain-like protein [Planctomicrobium sp. SH668]|uniref:enolase C-terminal domain-like protein n=1 Tax=Planctomicrobium sp. SH668 TaxID=3448126 RepID=UPI003F5B6730
MNRSSDVRIKQALITLEEFPIRTPLNLGGRVIEKQQLINVQVTLEQRDRKHAFGLGSMPIAPSWAWPSETVTADQAMKTMADFAERVVGLADSLDDYAHPVDLIYTISAEYDHLGKVVSRDHKLAEPVPPLAQHVAASALDAALHDGFGKVNGKNSYDTLSSKFMDNDLAYYLDDKFAGEYLDQYTLRTSKESVPLYHLVGALDPLTSADVVNPLKDGLPGTLNEWIAAEGLTHFKISLSGQDLDADLQRVLSVDQVCAEAHRCTDVTNWVFGLDFNENCETEEYVVTLLNKLREASAQLFDRIQFIEQPTPRNIQANPQSVQRIADLKPVVIDEALVDYDSLLEARQLGYSGVTIKSCHGHTEALFAAAAAQKFGMFMIVQDLVSPGFSYLHSASLAARIPGVVGLEANARQYCPAGNKVWARDLPQMFDVKNGQIATGCLNGLGLGF